MAPRRGLGSLAFTGAVFLLSSCAALRPRPVDPGAFLLSPASAGFSAELTQEIRFRKGANRFDSLAMLQLDPDLLTVAALGPLGNRVISMSWDGKAFREERDPSIPSQLPLKGMLRDLQLALWPSEALRQALPKGWILEDSPRLRRLLWDGRALIEIRYEGDDHLKSPLTYIHHGLDYQLEVLPAKEDEGE